MGICTDVFGADFCQPFGSSTPAHIDCATGWDDSAGFGQDQANARGCDVGCASCFDFPSEISRQVDWRDGRRWMRPTPAARNARGELQDLLTDRPAAIPLGVRYEFAACYQNVTQEQCFGRHVCRCWPAGLRKLVSNSNNPRFEGGCGPGVEAGDAIDAWFPDVFQYAGWTEPFGGGNDHYCRHFNSGPPARAISLGTQIRGGMVTPGFPRLNGWPNGYVDNLSCTTSALVPCMARFKTPGVFCESAFANSVGIEPGRRYWNDDPACRTAFDQLRITGYEAELAGGTRAAQEAAILRTAILRQTQVATLPGGPTGTRFDRVDALDADGDPSSWERSYNTAGDLVLLDDPRSTLMTLQHCTTKRGQPVPIRVRAHSARMFVFLVLHKIGVPGPGNGNRAEIEPHVRIRWWVEVSYESTNTAILPNNADPLIPPDAIYRLSPGGTRFSPPIRAEWLGYHGRLGVNFRGRYTVDRLAVLRNHCGQLARGLDRLEVFGWPNRESHDVEVRAWPYLGSVQIGFEIAGGVC